MKTFQLSIEDWDELKRLSSEARNTPVMALSVTDGIAGRDFASVARERVYSFWRRMGEKYGFDASTVRQGDESKREIRAKLVPKRADPVHEKRICIVFDGPPSHKSGRFVEVEMEDGQGLSVGKWIEREDGTWALAISAEDIKRALQT